MGFLCCCSRLTLLPTSSAQWKMRFFSGEPASTPARILAYTFSNTLGTLQMKCGRTSRRFSATLSRFSANAVVSPSQGAEERLEPRERVSQRQEQQVDPALLHLGEVWPDAVTAAM